MTTATEPTPPPQPLSSLVPTCPGEAIVFGTVLAFPDAPMGKYTRLVMEHSPESFADGRVGQAARAFVDFVKRGEPPEYVSNLIITCAEKFPIGSVLIHEAISMPVAEMEAEKVWKNYQTRQSISVLSDALAGLEIHAESTESIVKRAADALGEVQRDVDAKALPRIEDMAGKLDHPEPTPAVIVDGILHAGTKFVIGGGSKSFKTWVLLDLSASVATGSPWWGFLTHQGRVLYVNMEIPGSFFTRRLATILEAKGVNLQPGQLDHWPLRGHAVGIELLLPEILTRLARQQYALVVLDPVYKLYGGREENSAGDVANLLNALERVAVQSGAAVCFGSHFAKGNASSKEAIDRISGSGVFARDPDSILTMTRHEEDGVFAVDPILRNFPPVTPFCVRWEFPLMARTDANPERLKRAAGRPSRYRIEDILSCLDGNSGLTAKDWLNSAKEKHGIGPTKFYELKAEAVKTKKVRQSPIDDLWHLLS